MLHQAARTCRDMAAGCVTDEAREALLEVADELDKEATLKKLPEVRRADDAPIFNWVDKTERLHGR